MLDQFIYLVPPQWEQMFRGLQRVTGNAAGDCFGWDMLHEGSTMLATAPNASVGGIHNGAAYLFNLLTPGEQSAATADVVFVGEQSGEQAGWSLARADFNADGLSDVAIGSPYHSTTSYEGQVSLSFAPFGPVVPLSAADGSWRGDIEDTNLGFSMASGESTEMVTMTLSWEHHIESKIWEQSTLHLDPAVGTSVDTADIQIMTPLNHARFGDSVYLEDVNMDGELDLLPLPLTLR